MNDGTLLDNMFRSIQPLVADTDVAIVAVYDDGTIEISEDNTCAKAKEIANIFSSACKSLSSDYKIEGWDKRYYHLEITEGGYICMLTDTGTYLYHKGVLEYVSN